MNEPKIASPTAVEHFKPSRHRWLRLERSQGGEWWANMKIFSDKKEALKDVMYPLCEYLLIEFELPS